MADQAIKALDDVMEAFNGDAQRTYLTGLSMGGNGAWLLAAQYPTKFAALVPICGFIRPPREIPEEFKDAVPQALLSFLSHPDPYRMIAQQIGKMPVWAFHGSADESVPVEETRKMVESLKGHGGRVRYTEYAGVDHNSWDAAYAEPGLMDWLLAQRLD
ncbi:MAG: prolyl oligopeptidase family serine peptidase [Chloroflexota bacterium]|nr:prolyl oligopeptidase family serine peptidase [Chloroflexota bacterium]